MSAFCGGEAPVYSCYPVRPVHLIVSSMSPLPSPHIFLPSLFLLSWMTGKQREHPTDKFVHLHLLSMASQGRGTAVARLTPGALRLETCGPLSWPPSNGSHARQNACTWRPRGKAACCKCGSCGYLSVEGGGAPLRDQIIGLARPETLRSALVTRLPRIETPLSPTNLADHTYILNDARCVTI